MMNGTSTKVLGKILSRPELLMEIVGLVFDLTGALILAKEVWDMPLDIDKRHGLETIETVDIVVDGVRVTKHWDVDRVFALMSARKARLGFGFIALGALFAMAAKLLSLSDD